MATMMRLAAPLTLMMVLMLPARTVAEPKHGHGKHGDRGKHGKTDKPDRGKHGKTDKPDRGKSHKHGKTDKSDRGKHGKTGKRDHVEPRKDDKHVMHSARDCRTHVRAAHKQRGCLDCVGRGGRYDRRGDRCSGARPAPPPPPRAKHVMHSARDCRTYVRAAHKRRGCLDCVGRGGRYDRRGDRCSGARPAPPPPRVKHVMYTVAECRRHIRAIPERRRCVSCVQRRGQFDRRAAGRCSVPPPPPPPPPAVKQEMHSVADCRMHLRHRPKRQRCIKCTSHGGTFFRAGVGRCQMPAPIGPAVLTQLPECRQLLNANKRSRCRSCLRRGRRFDRRGVGRCLRPPPPKMVLNTPADCRTVANASKRRRCFKCIEHGGTFHRRRGRCHGARPPAPPLTVRMSKATARRGTDIRLYINPPHKVDVYYNGRLLPKRVLSGGRVLQVTVPGNAVDGYFEVSYRGRRYRAPRRLHVR